MISKFPGVLVSQFGQSFLDTLARTPVLNYLLAAQLQNDSISVVATYAMARPLDTVSNILCFCTHD
jgi:hypothetical protein